MNLIRTGETAKALAYVGLSVLLGVAALGLGLWLTRKGFA
jgi:fluoride ion exporter CrcB/FEX